MQYTQKYLSFIIFMFTVLAKWKDKDLYLNNQYESIDIDMKVHV